MEEAERRPAKPAGRDGGAAGAGVLGGGGRSRAAGVVVGTACSHSCFTEAGDASLTQARRSSQHCILGGNSGSSAGSYPDRADRGVGEGLLFGASHFNAP